MCRAQQDAGLRYRDSDNKESRFITHAKISNTIPRNEASLNIKLARKLPNKTRAKRQLAGLYEVLKPGSHVTKSSPTTTIINEPGRAPVKVRDSDLAMFGTKAERATILWTYAQRKPAPYKQTTETKIAKHSDDLKKQKRGEIKIRHRHRDTTSVVSSVNSNVTRALTVRKTQSRNLNVDEPQPLRMNPVKVHLKINMEPHQYPLRQYHHLKNNPNRHWYQIFHHRTKGESKNDLNSTALRRQTSHQLVH